MPQSSGPVLLLQLIGEQIGPGLCPGGAYMLLKELNREQTKVVAEGGKCQCSVVTGEANFGPSDKASL